MIAKIFRVLFSFNKKIFHDDSALSNFSGCLFLVTAAKLVNKLQFRNMKVSAFVFRKEAKKKKKTKLRRTTVSCMWVVVCCSLSKRTLLQQGKTPVHFTV